MQATYETQQSAITQIFWETKQILADNLLGRTKIYGFVP